MLVLKKCMIQHNCFYQGVGILPEDFKLNWMFWSQLQGFAIINITSSCLSQGSCSSVASRCCIFEEFYSHLFMAAAAHGDCREAAPTLGITECTNTSRPLGFRHQVLQAILLQKSCSNKKKDLLTKLVFDGDCAHEVELSEENGTR